MSNTSNNGGVNFMFVLIVGIVVATILNMLGGSGATTAPTTTTSNAGTSAERQYVTNRFRQEGYSEAESRQAAEAVLKFHEAQKARQR